MNARRGFLLVGTVGALFVCARWLRGRILPVAVAGMSMAPELQPGDYLLVWRTQLPRDVSGRIAYLRGPGGQPLLKRVIGLPGESVRAGAHVEVNGRPLLEPYARGSPPADHYRAVHRLADDEYFVLGDARAASTDSRDFGPVQASNIEGVVWLRYWPPRRLRLIRRARRVFERSGDSSAG